MYDEGTVWDWAAHAEPISATPCLLPLSTALASFINALESFPLCMYTPCEFFQ